MSDFHPIALIAGERYGVICSAFNAAGIPAVSCDLEPTEADCPHIQGDWYDVIPSRAWQLIIVHHECTALAVSGNHVYAKGKPKHHERLAAARSAEGLWRLCKRHSKRVAFENPRGVLGTMTGMGKAHMTIQPYEFGHDASKGTDYWLHDLPRLIKHPENRVPGRKVIRTGRLETTGRSP